MKNHLCYLIMMLVACAGSGCVSQKTAEAQAHQAYLEGQLKGTQQGQDQAPGLPHIFLRGPVRNPILNWTENMTLAQALVAADYTGFMNPVLVRVIRAGRNVFEARGIDLLHGQDFSLEAGDNIDIVP